MLWGYINLFLWYLAGHICISFNYERLKLFSLMVRAESSSNCLFHSLLKSCIWPTGVNQYGTFVWVWIVNAPYSVVFPPKLWEILYYEHEEEVTEGEKICLNNIGDFVTFKAIHDEQWVHSLEARQEYHEKQTQFTLIGRLIIFICFLDNLYNISFYRFTIVTFCWFTFSIKNSIRYVSFVCHAIDKSISHLTLFMILLSKQIKFGCIFRRPDD